MAVTFPLTTGQIPTYYNMRQSSRPFQKMGDYQDISTEPLYWFGHGLSYTTFEYSKAMLSAQRITRNQKIIAEVEIINNGDRSGKETVLWYVSDPVSRISRPMKELKYFEKKELKSGEKKVFRFEVDPMRDLSYPDANGKRIVESGEFIIQVGNQRLSFEIED